MQTYGELAFPLRTFWHIFGGAVLQVPVSAQTSGDGGLDLKLVFPAGLLCSSTQKVALFGIALKTAVAQETCLVESYWFSPQRR